MCAHHSNLRFHLACHGAFMTEACACGCGREAVQGQISPWVFARIRVAQSGYVDTCYHHPPSYPSSLAGADSVFSRKNYFDQSCHRCPEQKSPCSLILSLLGTVLALARNRVQFKAIRGLLNRIFICISICIYDSFSGQLLIGRSR